MKDTFLTNYSDVKFIDKIKDSLKKCNAFYFSVSFIKKAGLILFEREIEEALERGAVGRIITSTYQNFTDIASLKTFIEWQRKYDNFECHLDFNCFDDNDFHSKGYLFDLADSSEIVVGSSNITRFALLKNVEWNVSLISKDNFESYTKAKTEFEYLWDRTFELSDELISKYALILDYAIEKWDMDYINPLTQNVVPNSMQRKALKEIRRYRDVGVKKALIISATGSGKTYLAAFDARNFGAKRLLFIVHRETILKDAKKTFMDVFGAERTYGFYTGNENSLDADFIFATSNMLGRHLDSFKKDEFDYIIYDEVHHVVAETGKKIFEYLEPDFLLGLTATPERMDNQDIFNLFDQNVPFELRLRDAINNDLVVPFHYYGIRDQLVDYSSKDKMTIAKNIAEQNNIEFIKSQIEKYRKPGEKLKCIAFCTNIQSCKLMAEELYEEGYHTISLTGINDTGVRIKAFKDLQDDNNLLEIICTVDILNEGVDIPQVNMVLFLRPTESQTIFLQQLGRGLRKYEGKSYLTILDFIGNSYERSVQIAMALGTLGRTVYTEKVYLKNLIQTDYKSLELPGVEINIDELSKEEMINYINQENFNKRSFLKADYENFKKYLNINTIPKHMDYLESEIAPDLMRFIKAKIGNKRVTSYYNFLSYIGEEELPIYDKDEIEIINKIEELLPIVRADEYLIIRNILNNGTLELINLIGYNNRVTENTLKYAKKLLESKNIVKDGKLTLDNISNIQNYLNDLVNYGLNRYEIEFGDFEGEYKLYSNYTKEQSMTSINKNYSMNIQLKGTYIDEATGNTYIYVGLKKDKSKEIRTNYKDRFISPSIFQWESENNTTASNSIGIKLQKIGRAHV